MLRLGTLSLRSGRASQLMLRIRPEKTFRRNVHNIRCIGLLPQHPSLFIPRFADQHRSFSIKIDETQNGNAAVIDELSEQDHVTKLVLTAALGTLSKTQIDAAFQMIDYWLNTGSGYGVDTADRLLQRLVYEDAASPTKLRTYDASLLEWQARLLETWFVFNDYPLALERAENILLQLIERNYAGQAFDLANNASPSDCFVRLVASWLSLPSLHSPQGALRATDLLMWWTEDLTSASSVNGSLIPLFHKALDLCIETQNRSQAQTLIVRMGELQSLEEWNGIEPQESVWRTVNEMPTFTSSPGANRPAVNFASKGSTAVMSAEATVLRRLFFSFLETAKPSDADKVEGFAQNYEPLAITQESKEELYFALAEYYSGVRNVTKATQWVQKIDPSSCSNRALLEEALEFILRLWADQSSPEAPWRAHEILQRLEAIDAAKTASYSIVAEMWLSSSEPPAQRKGKLLLSRIAESFPPGNRHPPLDPHTLHIMVKYPREFKNAVSLLDQTNQFMLHINNIPRRLLPETVERLLAGLAKHAYGTCVNRVIKNPIVGTILTTSMCEIALRTQANSRLPKHTGYMFDYMLTNHLNLLSFHCYQETAKAVSQDMADGSLEIMKRLIRSAVERMASGDLVFEPEDFSSMIVDVSLRLKKGKRPLELQEILTLVESLFLQEDDLSPFDERFFTIESYNHLMEAWLFGGQYDKAEETFNHALKLYRSGVSTLMPTRFTFSRFLKYHSENSKGYEEVLRWCEKMIQIYKETKNEECKPDIIDMNIVMRSLAQFSASPKQATEYFDNMLEIGVEPSNYSFNQLLKTFLSGEDPYRDVINVSKRMHELGVESNENTALVILDACARASFRDRELALGTATQYLGNVRRQGRPLLAHYLSYFSAVLSLLPRNDPRHEALMMSAFQLACEDGLGNTTKMHLRSKVSNKIWKQLVEIENRTLPKSNSPQSNLLEPEVRDTGAESSAKQLSPIAESPSAITVNGDTSQLLNYIQNLGLEQLPFSENMAETPERLVELVEKSLDALAQKGRGVQAEELLRRAVYNLSITAKMCESALQAQTKSARPLAIVKLFDYLDLLDAPLTFECYRLTINALAHSKKEDRFEMVKGLMTEVTKRMQRGDLQVTEPQFESEVCSLVAAYGKYSYPQAAQDLVDMLENTDSEPSGVPPLSASVYKFLLDAWAKAGNFERSKVALERLVSRYKSDASQVIPREASFRRLSRNFCDLNTGSLNTAADYMDMWIQFYENTKDESNKLNDEDFLRFFRKCAQKPNEISAPRTISFLEKEIKLGIRPHTDSLPLVMDVLINNEEHAFRPVKDLVERMQARGFGMDKVICEKIIISCLKAQPEDHVAALETALRILKESHDRERTTLKMYRYFFQILEKFGQDDPRHDTVFEDTCRMCWSDKYRAFALRELKDQVDSSTWDRLTAQPLVDPPKQQLQQNES